MLRCRSVVLLDFVDRPRSPARSAARRLAVDRLALAVAFAAVTAQACGGRSERFDAERTGGTSGDGGAGASTGGSAGTFGAAGGVGASGGVSGSFGNGGSAGKAGSVGVAGVAGTGVAAGGSSGTSGTAGTSGGSVCGGMAAADPVAALPCSRVPVQTSLITDFADWDDGLGRWGGDPDIHRLTGGVYIYGETLAGLPNASSRNWTVRGTVQSYAGFGLWFDVRRTFEGYCAYNCLDAVSQGCEGIRFTLQGQMSAARPAVDVVLDIWDDRPNDIDAPGGCSFSSDATKYTDCVQPFVQVAPQPERMEYRIAFGEFTGGKPLLEGTGDQLVGVHFALPWTENTAPYDVALTVSDFSFFGESCVPPTLE